MQARTDGEEPVLARSRVFCGFSSWSSQAAWKGGVPATLLGLTTGIIFTANTFVHGAIEGCQSWHRVPFIANSVMFLLFGLGCFIAGSILRSTVSPRKLLTAAHALSVVSLLANAFSIEQCTAGLYIAASGTLGFGVGLIYMAGMSVTLSWYRNHSVIATALYSTCSGVSSLSLQVLNTYISESFGLQATFGTLMIAVGLFGTLCALVCSFGPFHHPTGSEVPICQGLDSVAARRGDLLLFAAMLFFTWAPGWGVISSLNSQLSAMFGTDQQAAARLALLPLGALTLGRLSVGALGQLLSPAALFSLYSGLGCIMCALIGYCEPYLALSMLSVVAWTFGATSSSFATYTIELFGTESYNLIIGFTLIAYGLSAMFSTILFSALPTSYFLWVMSISASAAGAINYRLAHVVKSTTSEPIEEGSVTSKQIEQALDPFALSSQSDVELELIAGNVPLKGF